MKTQHTPGPWYVSPLDERLMVTHDDGFVIALVSPNGSQRDANARLIASAPDLLRHLEILSAEDSQVAPDWVEKKKAARAALAKAKAEQA